MERDTHLHERIARATNRLAQLQAHDLITAQRKALRAREASRRDEARRKRRVADLVFAAGADTLDDSELVGALLTYREESDAEKRANSVALGRQLLLSRQADT